jgi:N-acetyl-anhydromuramyl-L-alanine amidase AmpD
MIPNLSPIPESNYTPGRNGNIPLWIVLHTTTCSERSADNTFHTPQAQRSAHAIVDLDGQVYAEVGEGDTAWHAANWFVNQRSFGLEHADNGNYNDAIRTDAEYAGSANQVADWCRRYSIPAVKVDVDTNHNPVGPGIVLHEEVSKTGTACPDGLDWQRIIRQAQEILGGTAPTPAVIPQDDSVHPVNQPVTVLWQNLQVRADATTNAGGNLANTPDGLLHAGNVITVTGYKHGDRVNQNGVNTDIWLRTVWSHWIFAGGTNFDYRQFDIPAPAPVVAPVIDVTVPPVNPPITTGLPAGITAWEEKHEVLHTKRTGTSVDVLMTGAKQIVYTIGQQVLQSGMFVSDADGKAYVRTEYGLAKGTWNGIPIEAFTDPVPAISVTTTTQTQATVVNSLDGIVRTLPATESVQTVSTPLQSLTLRQKTLAAIAALVAAGADLVGAVENLFRRKK